MLAIAERTKTRALAWLKRNWHLARRDGESNEEPTLTALEACAQLAMQRGEFAGVRIARDDDLGREKLCRYGARPPFAMGRIRRLPGGRIAYQTKAARGQRARSRVMTPIDFLARLAALVPPPRYPLVRFHGVLAPKSSWRKDVVPKPPTTSARERSPRAERCDEREKPIASSFPDRLRVTAVVAAEATVSKILDHLKVPSVAPPVARARAPDDIGESKSNSGGERRVTDA